MKTKFFDKRMKIRLSIVLVLFIFLIAITTIKFHYRKIDSDNRQKNEKIEKYNNSTEIEVITLQQFKSKEIYKKNCSFCHGDEGKGDGIKARINTEICPFDLTKENKTDKQLYYLILNGYNYMPSYGTKLDDNNINLLVIYIKKFRANLSLMEKYNDYNFRGLDVTNEEELVFKIVKNLSNETTLKTEWDKLDIASKEKIMKNWIDIIK